MSSTEACHGAFFLLHNRASHWMSLPISNSKKQYSGRGHPKKEVVGAELLREATGGGVGLFYMSMVGRP